MKKLYYLAIFGIFGINNLNAQAQDVKVKTEDGKVIILKSNKTWYYEAEGADNNSCDTKSDLVKAIPRLRKHVSAENEVDESKIKFINSSGGRNSGNGMFTLCVDGIKMKYRQMGTVYTKLGGSDF